MEDPLARFKRDKPVSLLKPELVSSTAPAREPYVALSTKDKNRGSRLDIRVREGLSHAVAYQHLYEITYDRRDYKTVYLIFNSLSVTIEGYNLRPIVDAVRLGSAEYILEFDETEHEMPLDTTAPFIEKITVVSAAEVRARKGAGQ